MKTYKANKVTKKQVDDAFDYFMDTGRLDELNYDDRYYIEVLLKRVANITDLILVFSEKELT